MQVKDIDGNPLKLDKYRGQVVLVVNVASACGARCGGKLRPHGAQCAPHRGHHTALEAPRGRRAAPLLACHGEEITGPSKGPHARGHHHEEMLTKCRPHPTCVRRVHAAVRRAAEALRKVPEPRLCGDWCVHPPAPGTAPLTPGQSQTTKCPTTDSRQAQVGLTKPSPSRPVGVRMQASPATSLGGRRRAAAARSRPLPPPSSVSPSPS